MRKWTVFVVFLHAYTVYSVSASEDPKCTDCHGDPLARKTVHAAAAEGACVSCHNKDYTGTAHPMLT